MYIWFMCQLSATHELQATMFLRYPYSSMERQHFLVWLPSSFFPFNPWLKHRHHHLVEGMLQHKGRDA
jgi:hypothetical protein